MISHRIVRIAILCILGAILLTGCFDMTQEIWIYANGSGKVSIDIGIEKSFATGLSASGDPFGSFNMETANGSLSEYDSEDMHHFVATTTYTDLNTLITSLQNDETGSTSVNFYQAENGNFILRQTVNFGGMASQQGLDTESIGMMNSMLNGKYFTVRIHVPNVVNSNGAINRLTNTVEWRIPIAEMYITQSMDMYLEYNNQTGPLGLPILVWIIIGAGIILLLLVVGIMLNLRDRRIKDEEEPIPPSIEPQ